jgi:two-component system sensor histidine kinase MprB
VSFRRRLALSCGAAVAVAVVLGSILTYVIVRDTLRAQIDASLSDFGVAGEASLSMSMPVPRDRVLLTGQTPVFTQIIREGGVREKLPAPLTDDPEFKAVAEGRRAPFFADRVIDRTHVRVYISRTPDGLALFRARPLTEVDRALSTLRWALGILALGGIALAVVLSRLATRTAIRPVANLTETAEHVASTRDLSRRIATQGDDEVSRLATSFNTMLEALERSQRSQRQLVADASHELRTPLTSLRTNLEVLARGGPPDPADRDRLRADLVAQLGS